MAQFNVDAEALLNDMAAQIGSLTKENFILRHQLKDAARQADNHTHDEVKDTPTP